MQAFGYKNYKRIGVILQRGKYINIIINFFLLQYTCMHVDNRRILDMNVLFKVS